MHKPKNGQRDSLIGGLSGRSRFEYSVRQRPCGTCDGAPAQSGLGSSLVGVLARVVGGRVKRSHEMIADSSCGGCAPPEPFSYVKRAKDLPEHAAGSSREKSAHKRSNKAAVRRAAAPGR